MERKKPTLRRSTRVANNKKRKRGDESGSSDAMLERSIDSKSAELEKQREEFEAERKAFAAEK